MTAYFGLLLRSQRPGLGIELLLQVQNAHIACQCGADPGGAHVLIDPCFRSKHFHHSSAQQLLHHQIAVGAVGMQTRQQRIRIVLAGLSNHVGHANDQHAHVVAQLTSQHTGVQTLQAIG